MKSEYKLVITLLSDALPGNGEGLANVIDTDTCYDDYGFPVIPSKRIKGILRETCKDMELYKVLEGKTTEEIFGSSGEDFGSAFRVSNGYLKDYQNLKSFIEQKRQNSSQKRLYNTEAVLKCYTYLRAQTAIDVDGIAKETSLRTKRVLKKGLQFECNLSIPDEYAEIVKKICLATRRFGINRTRGLGEIAISIVEQKSSLEAIPKPSVLQDLSYLELKIKNTGQILSSSEVGNMWVSSPYISGGAILGAFASEYISAQKLLQKDYNPSGDKDFDAMFISGELCWGNAYPCDGEKASVPVPLSWKRSKQSNLIYNLADDEDRDIINKDEILKSVPAAFVATKEMTFYSVSPELSIQYHHQRPKDRRLGSPSDKDGEFFQFEVLSEGQEFIARIDGKAEYLQKVMSLADVGTMYFGKSKTAQYGRCEVRFVKGTISKERLSFSSGDEIYLYLLSDAMILNEAGFQDLSVEAMQKHISALIAKTSNCPEEEIALLPVREKCFMDVLKAGGYMSIWNMPKIQQPALRAGSVFTFIYEGKKDIQLDKEIYLGIANERGYGRVQIDDQTISLPQLSSSECADDKVSTLSDFGSFVPIYEDWLKRKIKTEAIKDAEKVKGGMGSSQVRRVMAAVACAESTTQIKGNIKQIKSFENDKTPPWVKPVLVICDNVPDFFIKHLEQQASVITPDGNLSTILNLLKIKRDVEASYFRYIKLYMATYLRTLALAIRNSDKNKGAKNDQN